MCAILHLDHNLCSTFINFKFIQWEGNYYIVKRRDEEEGSAEEALAGAAALAAELDEEEDEDSKWFTYDSFLYNYYCDLWPYFFYVCDFTRSIGPFVLIRPFVKQSHMSVFEHSLNLALTKKTFWMVFAFICELGMLIGSNWCSVFVFQLDDCAVTIFNLDVQVYYINYFQVSRFVFLMR